MDSGPRAEQETVAGMNTVALPLAEQTRQENAAVAEGLKAHDPQLLDRLILQYQHRLRRYLLFLTGNLDLSEDLFQETWMRVLARGAQFRGNSQFVTWLFTIARNLVFDLRRRTTMASLEQLCDDGNRRPLEVPSLDGTPFDHYATRENRRLLSDAVRTLKPRQREVLVLRFMEDMSLSEIAGITGAPVATVKARLYRGLAGLRPHMRAVIQ
jgi:RNA polymerase sigma-70 factor (ECF subfamily)